MRIAINTRFLLKDKMEGFGWFTYETVKRMVIAHPEHHFIFLFDRPYDEKFIFADNITPVVIYPPARHPVLFKIWFDYSVTRALKKYKAEVFFSPDGYLSLRTEVPQIGVIHDLNFEHFPEDLPKSAAKYLKRYFPLFARKAEHIITVSEYSKQDIVDTYKIKPEKISVAYNGGSDQFKPISGEQKSICKKIHAGGKEFFVFVGALHPRKNLKRLLIAFDAFKKKTQSETKLLIVGEALWKNKSFETNLSKLEFQKDIHFTGHLSLDELTVILGSAKALTFVSYFEGFGIPLVEAMKAECPILSGDKTSLPEIAGDAARYVDPYDIDSITEGLIQMDSDENLRNQLIEIGKQRAELFNWDFTAEKIWQIIEQVAH